MSQGRKYTCGNTTHAHHAASLERDERNMVNGRYPLYPGGSMAYLFFYHRSFFIWIKGIFNMNRNIIFHGRLQRRRIHNGGAKVGEFHCLFIGKLQNRQMLADHLRIGGHYTLHLRPFFHCFRLQRRPTERCSITRPPATERRRNSIASRSNNAGNNAYLFTATEMLPDIRITWLYINPCMTRLVIRNNNIARMNIPGQKFHLPQSLRNYCSSQTFAKA